MRATSQFLLALALLTGASCGGPNNNDFDSTADAGEDPGGSGGSSGSSPTGGSPTGGSPTGGSSGSSGTTSGEGGTSERGGSGGTETGGEGGSAGSGAEGGSSGAGGAGNGGIAGGGKGGAGGAGAGGAGAGGRGGAGAGGRGGTSGGGSGGRGGAGGATICDPGCEPSPNQGNACDAEEVLWNCRRDEGLERFDASCEALATGDPRFCCPETFSPTCGEGTCSRFPQADEMLCGGDFPPRGYRCLFPATSLPDCVARLAGDVTTIVCCP